MRGAVMVSWIEIPDSADINVEKAVPVDVGHGHARGPIRLTADMGFGGDVFELEISFVKIKLVAPLIRRQIDIRQPVVVDIPDGNACAIIIIEIIQDAEGITVSIGVDKPDAGLRSIHFSEKHRAVMGTTGQQ